MAGLPLLPRIVLVVGVKLQRVVERFLVEQQQRVLVLVEFGQQLKLRVVFVEQRVEFVFVLFVVKQ